MEDLPLYEIQELNNEILNSDNFMNEFIVADLIGSYLPSEDSNALNSYPLRVNALAFVLILRGSVKVEIDYSLYTFDVNSFITIMPANIVQVFHRSDDFKARMMFVSQNFVDCCNPSKTHPSVTFYMEIRKNPCVIMTQEEVCIIDDYFQLLRNKIRMKNHHFQLEVLRNSFIGFNLEIGNIMVEKEKGIKQPVLSRKEEIFQQFLHVLMENCQKEHAVSFYAEKMFITPQYLSLVLKEITGKSASKWIDDALIVEAKILLKSPHNTVQQVADLLNYSDQSTFGKFFKKHMGISPLEYRKS